MLAQCSVFRGGFTPRDVTAVIQCDSAEVVDTLEALADRSLLTTIECARGAPRFGMMLAVREHEAQFVHHCSVSVAGGYTAHAVGAMFLGFTTSLLGLPWERMTFEIGKSTVHHGEIVLDRADHQALAARPVAEPSMADVTAFRQSWSKARPNFEWRRTEARPA